MSTRIGIISDIHSTTAPLKEAMSIFKREQVKHIICAGDIAGYGEDQLEQTIDLLLENDCLMISGNHDHCCSEKNYGKHKKKIKKFFDSLPTHLELNVEDKRIYVVHASPPDEQHNGIKLLNPEGEVYADRKADWTNQLKDLNTDVLIVGHTHQILCEQMGDVLVINPGSTVFNHNCSILILPDMQVTNYPLSNKTPIKVWNWSMIFKS